MPPKLQFLPQNSWSWKTLNANWGSMFTEFEELLWYSQMIQTVQCPLHSILCLYEHLWKTVANHTVLFYKWHLHISASTVVAMAVGVLRTDFLESHHTPWLNFFLCRVERSSGNWEKVRTTVLSFWWHSPGQWQIVAMGFWLHWHGFGYHQVWGSRPCQWGW